MRKTMTAIVATVGLILVMTGCASPDPRTIDVSDSLATELTEAWEDVWHDMSYPSRRELCDELRDNGSVSTAHYMAAGGDFTYSGDEIYAVVIPLLHEDCDKLYRPTTDYGDPRGSSRG